VIPGGWRLLAKTQGKQEADIIAGMLRASGIECFLDYEYFGAGLGITVDGMGEVRVAVREEDFETARALMPERRGQ